MSEQSLNTWQEFGAAVAYVTEIEQPSLALWDALAEALRSWLDDRSAAAGGGDELRSALAEVMHRSPEVGAPGGMPLGMILEAAMGDWAITAAERLNDGRHFST